MFVRDPDTGKLVTLYDSEPYLADLEAFRARECLHDGPKEVRLFSASNGAIHCRYQCLTCGEPVGQNLRKSNFESVSLDNFDLGLAERYKASRTAEADAITRRHLTKQSDKDIRISKQYQEYLQSPQWDEKRTKVLKRAGNICEGCGDERATQIHHRTYQHLFDEFLFELVALCPTCHARIHAEERLQTDVEPPCCACRFQSQDEQGNDWCGCHDIPANDALATDGPCGPEHKSEEPLK